MWDDLREYDKAIEDYVKAKECGMDKTVYYNCIAVANDKNGKKDQAIIFYTKAIEETDREGNPEFSCNLYSNRGSCYADIGEYKNALEDYTFALIYNSKSDVALQNRAITYQSLADKTLMDKEKLKYLELARRDLEEAFKINTERELGKRFLIEIYLKLKNMYENIAQKEFDKNRRNELLQQSLKYTSLASQFASALSLSKENWYLESKVLNSILESRKKSGEEYKFIKRDANGNDVEYSILFAFENEQDERYIVYTDESTDENGNINVYAGIDDEDLVTGIHKLKSIQSDEEWSLIEKILDLLQECVKKGMDTEEIEEYVTNKISNSEEKSI